MIVGVQRLLLDLSEIGFEGTHTKNGNDGISYAVIPGFTIPAGTFAGRVVDLAIPAPQDYPRSFGSSIHLKASPHLVPFGNVPNIRNVIESSLGKEWQYWSYRFNLRPTNPTNELICQINEIFRKN